MPICISYEPEERKVKIQLIRHNKRGEREEEYMESLNPDKRHPLTNRLYSQPALLLQTIFSMNANIRPLSALLLQGVNSNGKYIIYIYMIYRIHYMYIFCVCSRCSKSYSYLYPCYYKHQLPKPLIPPSNPNPPLSNPPTPPLPLHHPRNAEHAQNGLPPCHALPRRCQP